MIIYNRPNTGKQDIYVGYIRVNTNALDMNKEIYDEVDSYMEGYLPREQLFGRKGHKDMRVRVTYQDHAIMLIEDLGE